LLLQGKSIFSSEADQAKSVLEAGLNASGRDPVLLGELARFYESRDMLVEAENLLREAVQRTSNSETWALVSKQRC
jgi:hypothetical protein